MDAFLLSFGVVFLAELGDKSQLMAHGLRLPLPRLTVLLAVTIATLLVHAGSVLLGAAFALALPTELIQVAAGIAFFVFAAWTIRGDALGEDDEDRAARTGRWAVLTIGTAFFLAELGDKTMLATITLATTEEPIGTWLGSTAGHGRGRRDRDRARGVPRAPACRSARSRSSPRWPSSCSASC